jgi:PAS domain-containing protein
MNIWEGMKKVGSIYRDAAVAMLFPKHFEAYLEKQMHAGRVAKLEGLVANALDLAEEETQRAENEIEGFSRHTTELLETIREQGGTIQDLTVEKGALENKIAELDGREDILVIRYLIEHAVEPLIVLGEKGKIRIATPSAAKELGIELDDVVGTPFDKYFANSGDFNLFQAGIRELVEHGGETNKLTVNQTYGDKPVQLLLSAHAIRTNDSYRCILRIDRVTWLQKVGKMISQGIDAMKGDKVQEEETEKTYLLHAPSLIDEAYVKEGEFREAFSIVITQYGAVREYGTFLLDLSSTETLTQLAATTIADSAELLERIKHPFIAENPNQDVYEALHAAGLKKENFRYTQRDKADVLI